MKKLLMLLSLSVIFISCTKQTLPVKEKEVPNVEVAKPQSPKKLKVTMKQHHSPESSWMLVDGVYAKSKNEYDLAEQFLQRAIDLDTLNDAAYYELADLYRTEEKFNLESALSNMAKASAIQPDNTWYKTVLGQLYVDNGQTEKGIQLFQKLSKDYPQDVKYQYDLAYSYEQSKQYQKAIDVYDEIEEAHGFDPKINHQKHLVYFEMKEYDKGIHEIEEIIEKDESYVSYSSFLTNYFYQKGNLEKSKKYLEKVFNQDKKEPRANVIATEIAIIENQPEKIKHHLNTFLQLEELSDEKKVSLLVPLVGLSSDFPKSAPILVDVVKNYSEKSNNAKVYTLLGDFYLNADNSNEATIAFRKATQSDKEVPYAVYRQLMLLQSQTDDYANLEKDSKRAIEQYPDEFLPYYFNGFTNYQLRKYSLAILALEKASTYKKEKNYLLGDVYFYLAESYMELQQEEKAYQTFDKALEVTPNKLVVLNNYAYYLAQRNQELDKALNIAQQGVELEKMSANMRDTYAYVLFQNENYQEALLQSKIAFDLDKNKKASIAEHLGDCYIQVGEIDKALEYWRIAIERGANSPKLIEKITKKKYIE